MDKGAILLKDHVGEKSESTLGMLKRVVTGKSAVVNVLRGELVEPIPGDELAPRSEGQKPYNFHWKKDPAVLLYCHEEDIAPLSDKEFLLLEAIQTPAARYEVFISGEKLDWGCNLKPGDTVYVSIPGLTVFSSRCAAAVIRYVGGLPPVSGLMFGIEIMDEQCRGNGTTDGTFRDQRYFVCEDNCGLFVGLDKLSPDRHGSSLVNEPRGAKSYAKVASHGPQQRVQSYQLDNTTPADNTRSRSHVVSRPGSKETCVDPPSCPPRFQRGERVVAFTKKGCRVHGTVRWVGRNVASRKFTITVVGIETDVAVSGTDFEDCIPGMTYLFAATKNHHLFLPETTILSEEEATGANDGQRNKPHLPENIDVENTAALAREMGVSAETLLKNQEAALREANLAKEAQELEQLKRAIPEESLRIDRQQAALHAFKAEHIEKMQEKRASLPSGSAAASNYLQPSKHPGHPQRQHSYEPVVPSSQRKYLGSQTKAASISQGEEIYNRLDSRGYQHERSSGTLPATSYPTEPQTQPFTQNSGHQWSPQQAQYPQSSNQQQRSNHQAPYYQAPSQQMPYQQKQTPQQLPDVHIHDNAVAYVPNVSAHASHHQVYRSLSIGSTVQITGFSSTHQDGPPPPRYGVIRWVGDLPGVQGPIAGIELEEPMEGCTDGTFQMTGHKFFDCRYGRGLYFPLASLRPDERFTDPGTVPGAAAVPNPLDYVAHEEVGDQLIGSQQMVKYLGEERGIQGHQNSCYLDATVFGLFALSDVFDSMFLKNPTNPTERDISSILWKRIVNPLRKNGVVRYESVMMLRNKLEELGKMKGVTQDEKDPEEFLNMLFKHTLHVEPFISIRRPFGKEQEYFVQLFLEYDESMKLPSVGELLTKMFKEQNISFTESPSRLLIQVPRFGKQFKTYQKIVPNLSLDVVDLVDSPYSCFICDKNPAWQKCRECALEFNKQSEEDTHLCLGCTKLLHGHPQRAHHKVHVEMSEDVNTSLELLSVICIETSHYVCFTRSEDQWILFDSMANRVHDMYNIPRVVDCTRDLKEWVYSGDHQRLLNTPPRDLPEYVRRFTQDVYMCVYVYLDAGMYG